jgi:hypothetical protein
MPVQIGCAADATRCQDAELLGSNHAWSPAERAASFVVPGSPRVLEGWVHFGAANFLIDGADVGFFSSWITVQLCSGSKALFSDS